MNPLAPHVPSSPTQLAQPSVKPCRALAVAASAESGAAVDTFAALGAIESGLRPTTWPRANAAGLRPPLQLRGGAPDLDLDVAACCAASGASLLAWAGGVLGFALPLAVGIENLIPSPSTFNPSGQQNLGLGVTMVVLGATVFPSVGAVAGGAVGALLCGGPFLCLRRS